jgi:hypothetical protein
MKNICGVFALLIVLLTACTKTPDYKNSVNRLMSVWKILFH